jgi:hypothetical protein
VCLGLEEGQPCLHESACQLGDCVRSEPDADTTHRGHCEALQESRGCERDRQCLSARCVNNECTRPPQPSSSSSSLSSACVRATTMLVGVVLLSLLF